MDRPTTEIKLQDCEATITLYSFLTGGDFRKLQKTILEGTKIKLNQDIENLDLGEVSGSMALESQDITLKLLLKGITTKDGLAVENTEDFIYNLTMKDSAQLYAESKRLTDASTLPEVDKKK